jgi:hypothetical protein
LRSMARWNRSLHHFMHLMFDCAVSRCAYPARALQPLWHVMQQDVHYAAVAAAIGPTVGIGCQRGITPRNGFWSHWSEYSLLRAASIRTVNILWSIPMSTLQDSLAELTYMWMQ